MDTVEAFSGKKILEVGGIGCAKKTNNKKTAILKKQSAIPGDGTVP